MDVTSYMKIHFPSVQLKPSLTEQWGIGIHFSLGNEIYQLEANHRLNQHRFLTVYNQALQLFFDLFNDNDEIFFVTNVYKVKKDKPRKMKVYKSNVKNKNILNRLIVRTFPYPFEKDSSDDYEMQQFSLRCHVNDIQIEKLLKGAIHEDFPLKPKFSDSFLHYPDVFLINLSRHLIFFVYDDRGCEVIAKTTKVLQPLYKKYANLID